MRNWWKTIQTVCKGHKPVYADPVLYGKEKHGIDASAWSQDALRVVSRLSQAGYQTYLVGGCVRDMLSGMVPKDYDIVTDAKPEEIKKIFKRSRIIGRRFRLVHVYTRHDVYEVNTFRALPSNFARWLGRFMKKHALNNMYGNRDQDVWRRDFTMNALYFDASRNQIIDYVGGFEDIKAGSIRMIGDNQRRVESDPVRILRALRFCAKTKCSIDPDLKQVLIRYGYLLRMQSKDRLYLEVEKLFEPGIARQSLALLVEYGVFPCLFHGFRWPLHEHDKRFLEDFLWGVDQVRGKKMTTGAMLAGFFWPMLAYEHAEDHETLNSFDAFSSRSKKILHDIAKSIKLTRATQFDMVSQWKLQFHLKHLKKEDCLQWIGKPKFTQALRLLQTRAKFDESLIDCALYWAKAGL